MNTRNTIAVAAMLVTGTLVACGGSGNNEPGTGTGAEIINQFGMVQISDSSQGSRFNYNAAFYNLSNTPTFSQVQSVFNGTPDTCTVEVIDFNNIPEFFPYGEVIGNTTHISAGDAITFRSPSGSFMELGKYVADSSIIYVNDAFIDAPPAELVVDVPGDEFPAFPDVQVPEIQSIVLTTPTYDQTVTTDSVFTWTAGGNPNAYVTISAADGNGSSFVTVDCDVRDNGRFSFPETTKAELGIGFSPTELSITRTAINYQLQGNTILVVLRDSSSTSAI